MPSKYSTTTNTITNKINIFNTSNTSNTNNKPSKNLSNNTPFNTANTSNVQSQQAWRRKIFKVDFMKILPNEILVKVISFVRARDVGRLSMVCQSLREVAQDVIIWEHLVAQGEHHRFHVEPCEVHLLALTFQQSLKLPINRMTCMGKGKDFPYPPMFLSPCHIQCIANGAMMWLVLKKPCPEYTRKCIKLLHRNGSVQEFYIDPKKRIPRREYEPGLEVGGFFFQDSYVSDVANLFNQLFH